MVKSPGEKSALIDIDGQSTDPFYPEMEPVTFNECYDSTSQIFYLFHQFEALGTLIYS